MHFGIFCKVIAVTTVIVGSAVGPALAATVPAAIVPSADGDFSIQVSPSPLVNTVEPGKLNDLEIRIRNGGSQTEDLRIQPRSFTIDNASESVKLNDNTPPEVTDWLSFSAPTFSVGPGQTYIEKLRVNVPKDAGFSYAFALVLSRQRDPNPVQGNRVIKGSLAIFTLLNVDRPGAVRKLDVATFKVSKRIYEYLPADLSIQFKNSGNTIVQPYGNIFIQRGQADQQPLSTLPVNETRGYILPGSTRTLQASWSQGFPVHKITTDSNGSKHDKLVWDWHDLNNIRIGKYTAKLVAVYNDGQRDVPIEGMVSFWVIPWKILGAIALVILLVLFGIGTLVLRAVRIGRRAKSGRQSKASSDT